MEEDEALRGGNCPIFRGWWAMAFEEEEEMRGGLRSCAWHVPR